MIDLSNHPPALFYEIANNLGYKTDQITAVCHLLADGATIPFIARYRKEATGSLNEVDLAKIRDEAIRLMALHKRKLFVLNAISEQDKLTLLLEKAIWTCNNLTELEDIYLPFRSKKRTKATIAKEKGLEPLADWLWQTKETSVDKQADLFVNPKIGVANIDDALAGARDILAERINETIAIRQALRIHLERTGAIQTTLVKSKADDFDAQKFKDYFQFNEPLKKMPSHRILAILRGVELGFIRLKIVPDEAGIDAILARNLPKKQGVVASQIWLAAQDAYKRLAYPSLENESIQNLKEKADLTAIDVFKQNLRNLLMAPPLGKKRVLGVDPGFRTGSKVVCISETGQLLAHDVAFIVGNAKQQIAAAELINNWIIKFKIEAIAIGNGTAGRETESFIKQTCQHKLPIIFINESGASIYSASEIAREEFPNLDLTVRGAVSIARRLLDPLSELVKLDPKSIGVGQYQHDVNQQLLQTGLDDTVVQCVNAVGVDVNTASASLLQYIAGLNKQVGKNIVQYRENHGPFKNRFGLQKVPRLGPKAFEQSAGFLRIYDGDNPLDSSAVHPERYNIVEKIASDLQIEIEQLVQNEKAISKIDLEKYVTLDVGLPTLLDVINELKKPGRDPRQSFEQIQFDEKIQKPTDLKEGMVLDGIVTNVTNFGAFVDIGVHQDGLIHVSQLSESFVKDPNLVVRVGQSVKVKILELDLDRKRISLTRKGL